ncbi:MAG: hypothetical protein AAGF71_04130 [Pseudomonadota bacterium]
MTPKSTAVADARAAWGDDCPDWVMALAQECERTSQTAVGRQLGRSPSLVSQTLRKRYAGDMGEVERRVRAILMPDERVCPVAGRISSATCQAWRDRAENFQPTNTTNVRMARACRTCVHNRKDDADGDS